MGALGDVNGVALRLQNFALADTLRVSTRIRKGEATASVKIGNPKKGVFYAGMVMGGTRPHLIKGRVGPLVFLGLVRADARHPGAKANPFMNKGDDAARDQALAAAFAYADERTLQLVKDQGN